MNIFFYIQLHGKQCIGPPLCLLLAETGEGEISQRPSAVLNAPCLQRPRRLFKSLCEDGYMIIRRRSMPPPPAILTIDSLFWSSFISHVHRTLILAVIIWLFAHAADTHVVVQADKVQSGLGNCNWFKALRLYTPPPSPVSSAEYLWITRPLINRDCYITTITNLRSNLLTPDSPSLLLFGSFAQMQDFSRNYLFAAYFPGIK